MSRFAEILRRTNERLDLPQPAKSRILLEIASDLRDLYEAYLEQGLGEEEAARRAEEKFDLSDEALTELIQIHETFLRMLLGRISEQAQTKWERALLTLVVFFIASFSGRELFSARLLERASPFVWPVLGISLATLSIAVFQSYRLYIKKDHDVRRLRAGLHWLLAGGAFSLLAGLTGTLYEMHRSVALSVAEVEKALLFLVDWALRCSALMIVSLDVAIAAGIIWFVLMNKARSIEIDEAAWLLE